MSEFTVLVQYNDWKGASAADDADSISLSRYLKNEGLINEGEFLIAASLWVGENHGGKLGVVGVRAFLYAKESTFEDVKSALNAEQGPIPVRVVEVELTLDEYVGLFKRFAVILTRKDLNIEGREYVQAR